MKTDLASIFSRVLLVVFVFLGLPAWGTGQPGTQGPRFLGYGLDDPEQKKNLSFEPGYIQTYKLVNPFPPLSEKDLGPVALSPKPVFQLSQLSCKPTGNVRVALCTASVSSSLGPPVCTTQDGTKEPVHLIAINAAWDSTKATLNFASTTDVVFACEDLRPDQPDPQDLIGAFGKCIGWKFFPNAAAPGEFLACVRAARGDYCGKGISYTRPGTHFVVYDSLARSKSLCRVGECFEASWDADGAGCINHLRYSGLRIVASLSKYAVHYQAAFPEQGGGGEPKTPGSTAPTPAEPSSGPSIDGLKICGPQYDDALTTCLDDYHDLFYDDKHPMTLADPTAIDYVTGQYVCKSGKLRTNVNGLFTRTMVRFPLLTGGVDKLPCCDTLGCP